MKRILPLLCIVVGALAVGCNQTGEAAPSGQISREGRADAAQSQTVETPLFDGSVWVIGDSITVGAADTLAESHPNATVNAEVGRKFSTGIRELTTMLEQSTAPDVLVFALGTNNGATQEQVDEVISIASDVDRIIFVNVSVPRGWETTTNLALDQARASHANVTVVDWHEIGSNDGSLLRSDGYHPNADGSALWAFMITNAIGG